MSKATFRVPFEDFDYEGWAIKHALAAWLEPTGRQSEYLLHVEGSADAIDAFAAELSWEPETRS